MQERVRLTVQVRDHRNHVRVTVHEDVDLSNVAERSTEIATKAATFYKTQRRKVKAEA